MNWEDAIRKMGKEGGVERQQKVRKFFFELHFLGEATTNEYPVLIFVELIAPRFTLIRNGAFEASEPKN